METNMSDKKAGAGIDRRGVLECMIWAGAGVIWTLAGGVPQSSQLLGIGAAQAAEKAARGFSFLQILDSHVGFNKPANPDALGTLQAAIDKVKALPAKPAFMIHTGDITHLSKPRQFDDAERIIGEAKLDVHYVPGEHDIIDENNGQVYLERHGKNTKGTGWFAFDQGGVHFIGLVNVANLKAGGMGALGDEQLAWLAADLKGKPASLPISSSRIFRSGRFIRNGAGAQRIRRARSLFSSGSARSPCSTAISIN
jgi:3',5'-cyclic-AMP phosphodiesterase